MTPDQLLFLGILAATLVLLVLGRPRYDVVALLSLLALVAAGLVSARDAFGGFAHPAVITVAAVLAIGKALQNAGTVDLLSRVLRRVPGGPALQIPAQAVTVALLSAVMNNVGALAIVMPVAIRGAARHGYAPARVLMLLAFASQLGGLLTLIGTPPNLVVSAVRAERLGEGFGMFAFFPVGLAVAAAGIALLLLVGWRLVPTDRPSPTEPGAMFDIGAYVMEAEVPEGAAAAGTTVRELEALADGDAVVVGILRGGRQRLIPHGEATILAGDTLLLEADAEPAKAMVEGGGLVLKGQGEEVAKAIAAGDVVLVEAVLRPDSPILGRTATSLRLRHRHNVNLLGLARGGRRLSEGPGDQVFQAGDALLLQAGSDGLAETLQALGAVPLAEREIDVGRARPVWLAGAIFGAGIVAASVGVPPAIAFVTSLVGLIVAGVLRPDEAWAAIDWPVVILLGALLPLGDAMDSTGTVDLLVGAIRDVAGDLDTRLVVPLLLVTTMLLADPLSNSAAALLMAPVAISLAQALSAPPDALLMAVAVGAGSTFLTPVGHQSNTLVMQPGGYRFTDYARVGAPLSLLVAVVGSAMVALVWF
jgi:di/tricarboxylate transporter